MTAPAWYVYAVVPDGAPVPHCTETILPGADLLVLAQAERREAIGTMQAPSLAALVSPVTRALFAPDDPASRAADPDWVAARAAAHHAVVTALAASAACLPLGFGTLFSSGPAVRQWLAANQSALGQALAEVGECAEWSLSVIEDEAAHTEWVARHDPGLRALADQTEAAGPGTAYLRTRQLARARTEARANHRARATSGIADRLSALPVRTQADPDGSWTLLGNPACNLNDLLIPIADSLAGTGLTMRIAGPFPPYGFARAAFQACARG